MSGRLLKQAANPSPSKPKPTAGVPFSAHAFNSETLNEGAEPVGSKPEEFAATIKSEIAKWAKVIRDAGIKPQ